jgi:hypothetical protein
MGFLADARFFLELRVVAHIAFSIARKSSENHLPTRQRCCAGFRDEQFSRWLA